MSSRSVTACIGPTMSNSGARSGVPAVFEKSTVEDHAALATWGFGEEIVEMYAYAVDFGYDGGDPSVQTAEEVRVKPRPRATCFRLKLYFYTKSSVSMFNLRGLRTTSRTRIGLNSCLGREFMRNKTARLIKT
jgi:hypothetical protein